MHGFAKAFPSISSQLLDEPPGSWVVEVSMELILYGSGIRLCLVQGWVTQGWSSEIDTLKTLLVCFGIKCTILEGKGFCSIRNRKLLNKIKHPDG